MTEYNVPALFDVRSLRKAMGAFLTGVTVVTTIDEAGRPRGITANSFTSVSLEPPLVLICIDRKAASFDAFSNSAGYVVHLLGAHQQELAMKFASKDVDKFAAHASRPGLSGAPILSDVQAWIDCLTDQVVTVGDHILLIGRVQAFRSSAQQPLGYHLGQFVSYDADSGDQKIHSERTVSVGWVLESSTSTVALERKANFTYSLPRHRMPAQDISGDAMAGVLGKRLGCRVEDPFLYSMFPQSSMNDEITLIYRGVIPENAAILDAAADIEFLKFDEIPWELIPDRVERGVVRRYIREHNNGTFGIYSGSELKGTVAMIGNRYESARPVELANEKGSGSR